MSNLFHHFDEEYFLRGKQTGKSLYENYRWMPELTIPMTQRIVAHLGISVVDTVLDFGCARGYVVRVLREMGCFAYGTDTSEWAIANCDPAVAKYVSTDCNLGILRPDWVIAKDVLEHIPAVVDTISQLMDAAQKGVFAVVPLSPFDNAPYVVEAYERDVTHIHRLALPSWAAMFMRPGWSVEARYRLHGVKDNYRNWPDGNGFITIRRVKG